MDRRWKIFSLIAVLSLVADQLSKAWARGNLVPGRAVHFLGGVWDWELSFNPGSAFGLLASASSARIVLSAVAIAACVAIVVYMARNAMNAWAAAGFGLVFSGALGNLIDRVWAGKVTDFVLWHVKDTRWPAFNVADAALVVGVGILFFALGRDKKKTA